MADNNPASDRYNPPGINSRDFERFQFSELEVNELFWQTDQPGDNYSWRKVNQTQALNIRRQTTHNFDSKTVVYQKI